MNPRARRLRRQRRRQRRFELIIKDFKRQFERDMLAIRTMLYTQAGSSGVVE